MPVDPALVPVVLTSGQCLSRDEVVGPVDLMARAAELAFDRVPAARSRVDRISVVDIMTRTGPAPARQLAGRLGCGRAATEVTTVGGNSPQWLVNRAASEIAAGRLSMTLIAGAEAIRSGRARRAAGLPRPELAEDGPPDPVVGDGEPGVGPAEGAAGLAVPIQLYPILDSALASRRGQSTAARRAAIGALLAPFTAVAARHPVAWFPTELAPERIATPAPDNRVVAEPYTKLMTAFLGSDQGAALVVCSLAEARRAGAADDAVFIWAGADARDVRFPVERPDLAASPGIAAVGRALFSAAGAAGGRPVGIDDVAALDLYSCFPVAVELGAAALGVSPDDSRGLTVTGGLPYFGGPGNNYTTHAVATLCDRLHALDRGGGALGLATGLGWFVTKHSAGLYGTAPPDGGYRRGDTSADQREIDATALATTTAVDGAEPAVVVGATVLRDRDGSPTGAPLFAELAGGTRVAATPADDAVLAAAGDGDVAALVGTVVTVAGAPPRYRLAES